MLAIGFASCAFLVLVGIFTLILVQAFRHEAE
jgi:hypothetical protein